MLNQQEFTKLVKITKRYGVGKNGRRFANLELRTDKEVWTGSVIARLDHNDSEATVADIKRDAWAKYQKDRGVLWTDMQVSALVDERLSALNEVQREFVDTVVLELRDAYEVEHATLRELYSRMYGERYPDAPEVVALIVTEPTTP